MARPKRFELLTPRFVVWCSIQLSYGRLSAGACPAERRVNTWGARALQAGMMEVFDDQATRIAAGRVMSKRVPRSVGT